MKTKLTCPNLGTLVTVELHRDPTDGHILGIERCSAFEPGSGVDCDELCARLLNERLRRRRGR
jgi:hypothetical protein